MSVAIDYHDSPYKKKPHLTPYHRQTNFRPRYAILTKNTVMIEIRVGDRCQQNDSLGEKRDRNF